MKSILLLKSYVKLDIYIETQLSYWVSNKMSLDVFGRNLEGTQVSRGPPGLGFNFSPDGNFDMENKRLCNVGEPIDLNDAVSMQTLKSVLQTEMNYLASKLVVISEAIEKYQEQIESFRSDIDNKVQYLYKESDRNISAINYIINELNKQLNVTIVETVKDGASKDS